MSEATVGRDGLLRLPPLVFRCATGRGGLRADKREGDEATPLGVLPLRHVLYRADRVARPRTALPVAPLAPDDGWCDDPDSRSYNKPVRLPFDDRHETLWRQDSAYDVIAVLGWNDAPVARGLGSAIFLHVTHADYAPTAGCVALALPDLLACLAAGLDALRID